MLLHFASAALKLGLAVSIGLRVLLGLAPGSGTLTPFWRMHAVKRANRSRTRAFGAAVGRAPLRGFPALEAAGFPGLGAEAWGIGAPAGGAARSRAVTVAARGAADALTEAVLEEPPHAASVVVARQEAISAGKRPGHTP
jgi:hypothetical protein